MSSIDWTKPDAAMRRALELQQPRPAASTASFGGKPLGRLLSIDMSEVNREPVNFKLAQRVFTQYGPGMIVSRICDRVTGEPRTVHVRHDFRDDAIELYPENVSPLKWSIDVPDFGGFTFTRSKIYFHENKPTDLGPGEYVDLRMYYAGSPQIICARFESAEDFPSIKSRLMFERLPNDHLEQMFGVAP